MTPGSIHVITKGSNVWLDDNTNRYLRLPKDERPREHAEWSDERAGPLQDAMWHPMISWEIGVPAGHPPDTPPGLMITYMAEDEPARTWFPEAVMA